MLIGTRDGSIQTQVLMVRWRHLPDESLFERQGSIHMAGIQTQGLSIQQGGVV